MKMKMKRWLAISTILALIVSTMPVVAFADDSQTQTVAQIDNMQYTSLQLALEAVPADADEATTIKLLNDITLTAAMEIDKKVILEAEQDVTIDTATNGVVDAFTVVNGGTLTLGENLTIECVRGALWVEDSGKLVIDGTNISQAGGDYVPVAVTGEGSRIELKSGVVQSEDSSALAAFAGASIEISGGSAISAPDFAAYASGNATITVKDDAKVINNNPDKPALIASSTYATTGGNVVVEGGTVGGVLAHEHTDASATITGGTITGPVGVGEGNVGKLTITGGTFNSDVTAYIDQTVYEQKDSGEVVQYAIEAATIEELQNAIAAGMRAITLTAALTFDEEVLLEAEQEVTIDAAGVTDAFLVTTGGELTLGKNIIIESDTAILWANGGKINIDGAQLTSSSNSACLGVAASGSTINVKAGSVNGTGAQTTLISRGTINVTGGAVTASKCTAMVAKGGGLINIEGGLVEVTEAETGYCAVYAINSGSKIVVKAGTIKSAADAAVVPTKDTTAEISGGTLTGYKDDTTRAIYVWEGAGMTITGGTFNSDVTAYIDRLVYGQNAEGRVLTHNWIPVEEKSATCSAEGVRAHFKCEGCELLCEDKADIQFVELADLKIAVVADAHKWETDYTVDQEATCSEEGSKSIHCEYCTEKKSVTPINKLPHTEGAAATCTTAQSCTVCKATLAKAKGHSVAKTTTTQAAASKDGKIVKTCSCGYKISESKIYKASIITLSASKYVYSGSAKKPKITVKNSKKQVIGTSHYTVSYKNNVNVGKATVTIKFKGNYKGNVTKTFVINPKATKIKSVTGAKKALTVKWNKVSKQATGYEIMLATNSKFTKGKKTVKVTSYKTVSKKITKLTAKKKYYVRVRTYKTVNGKKYYSAWSKAKTVKTK